MLGTLRRSCAALLKQQSPEIGRGFRQSCAFRSDDGLTGKDSSGYAYGARQQNGFRRKTEIMRRHPRGLSTAHSSTAVPLAACATAVTKDESREFMALFPDVVRDLTDAGRHLDVPEVTKWFAKVLQYNVPGGKKNRGLALVYSYRMLTPESQRTEENIRLAQIMGWCVEMLQAFLLVIDDIMDGSSMRRGRPCWYRQNGIGLAGINDGLLLEMGLYQLLRRYFQNKPYYMQVVELFHDVTLKTHMGQALDLSTSQSGKKPNYAKFTMDRYNAIVKYKTAYYSFHLPVALALYMAGYNDEEMHRQAKTILLEMGHFFQVQDDFLDCFGDPEITGKVGSDIADGKCSWLAVVALQRATPEQRAFFEECYASKAPEKVAAVKELYEQLGIPTTYAIYEEESYNIISTHIQQMSRGLPHQLFFKFMEKIYRREC
ncbi:farnesyl pyrophosphate synthase-like [Schistocerca gregaria]|uniref:farnesyl pyrophosphate synthase-like n=1 Tax=Schistocerca gregaria TaxID=7010 RepID=UPI00211EA0DF|nr:farnesyl pyrophosphate synthase-like [Schistocerca gregaria]